MMAAEAGAARNTLLAYERDLRGASDLLEGGLGSASSARLKGPGEAWLPLKRATVARKAAALRLFIAIRADEGRLPDAPSAPLPGATEKRRIWDERYSSSGSRRHTYTKQ